jgi:predicted transcriptional regulator
VSRPAVKRYFKYKRGDNIDIQYKRGDNINIKYKREIILYQL